MQAPKPAMLDDPGSNCDLFTSRQPSHARDDVGHSGATVPGPLPEEMHIVWPSAAKRTHTT